MSGFEILDTEEPLNSGRLLLNKMYSGMTIYWSGSTGTDSIIRNNNNGDLKNRATATGSLAGGISNAAQDTYSVSFWGSGNTAHTAYSTVINGIKNSASGYSSTIINGSGNTIKSNFSFIGGGVTNQIQILSPNATILGGYLNVISGESPCSTILGGSGNTIWGNVTFPSNSSTIIGGLNNSIVGDTGAYSPKASTIIGGLNNKIKTNYGIILGGTRNMVGQNSFSCAVMGGGGLAVATLFTFKISGSISSAPAPGNNTISLQGDTGEGYAEGGFSTGPADIAEMFQFADGNPDDEDRRGLFVSLTSGGTIEIGNKNIIGAVSSNPGYIGDAAEMKWSGIYVKDEFGTKMKDTYKLFSWKENNTMFKVFQSPNKINYTEYPSPIYPKGILYNGEPIPDDANVSEFIAIKTNPDFNPQQEYEPRLKRKEWVPVGLLGKIHIRTAEQITSTHIDVDTNGMAINGTKYIVLKHIEEHTNPYGIVQIFIK